MKQVELVETLRRSGIGHDPATDAGRAGRAAFRKRLVGWGGAVIGVGLLLLLAAPELGGLVRGIRADAQEPVAVRIRTVVPTTAGIEEERAERAVIEATGHVVADRATTVSSSVVGRVAEVRVKIGDRVREGDVVARLDDRSERIELARLRIDLKAALANLKAREAELTLARQELERIRPLVRRGIASKAAYDDKTNRLKVMEAERTSAALAVEMARKRIALQEQAIRELIIRAPFGGLVTHVAANSGEIVSPTTGSGTFTRSGICTIVDLDSLLVSVQLAERLLPGIAIGGRAYIAVPALGKTEIAGRVKRIAPFADRQTGTVDVFIAPEPSTRELIRPGMRADVRFVEVNANRRPEGGAAVVLPAGAVRRDERGDHIFTVRAGRAWRQEVTGVRLTDGRYRLMGKTWKTGRDVVVWSQRPLHDGAPIVVR